MDQDGQLMIFKWKTGIDDIDEIEYDLQIQAYVLAAMQTYNTESCKAFVYNPIISQRKSHTFTAREKERIEKEIQQIISVCTGVCPPTVPTGQCDYCLGNKYGTCPEWRENSDNKEVEDTKPEIVAEEIIKIPVSDTQEASSEPESTESEIKEEYNENETQQTSEKVTVFDCFGKIGGIIIVIVLIVFFLILVGLAN